MTPTEWLRSLGFPDVSEAEGAANLEYNLTVADAENRGGSRAMGTTDEVRAHLASCDRKFWAPINYWLEDLMAQLAARDAEVQSLSVLAEDRRLFCNIECKGRMAAEAERDRLREEVAGLKKGIQEICRKRREENPGQPHEETTKRKLRATRIEMKRLNTIMFMKKQEERLHKKALKTAQQQVGPLIAERDQLRAELQKQRTPMACGHPAAYLEDNGKPYCAMCMAVEIQEDLDSQARQRREECDQLRAEVEQLRALLRDPISWRAGYSWGGEPIRTSASGTAQAMGCTNVQKPADPAGEGGGDG